MIAFLRHGYGSFDAEHGIGPTEWPHHDLLFVHRGSIALTFDTLGTNLALKAGEGVLIWPRTPFHGRATTPTALASIQHFQVLPGASAPFDRLLGQRCGLNRQTVAGFRELARDVDRAIRLARRLTDDTQTSLVRQALLALELAEGGFLTDQSDERRTAPRIDLETLERWLRLNLAANPGVPGLAREAGLSPSRFRAVFRAEHGRTAGEFILSVREHEARRRLMETRAPLKEIAAAVGYADVVAFHRAFKARTGLTPATFRRLHRITG